jgi:hypothetical protein
MGGFANTDWTQLANINSQMTQGCAGFTDALWNALLGDLGGRGLSSFVDEEGWCNYINWKPDNDDLCQFKQPDAPPWIDYPRNLHPALNIAYLKWRLTGIAKGPL